MTSSGLSASFEIRQIKRLQAPWTVHVTPGELVFVKHVGGQVERVPAAGWRRQMQWLWLPDGSARLNLKRTKLKTIFALEPSVAEALRDWCPPLTREELERVIRLSALVLGAFSVAGFAGGLAGALLCMVVGVFGVGMIIAGAAGDWAGNDVYTNLKLCLGLAALSLAPTALAVLTYCRPRRRVLALHGFWWCAASAGCAVMLVAALQRFFALLLLPVCLFLAVASFWQWRALADLMPSPEAPPSPG